MSRPPPGQGLVLTTERLRLRQPVLADAPRLAALVVPEAVHRHLGGAPTPEESWNRFVRGAGCWALFGYGPFVVETAAGRLVGSCGVFRGRRGLGPAFDGLPEAAWVMAQWAWGGGFAREAMAAILGWLDESHGVAVVAMITPDNASSIALAGKLGFRAWGQARYRDEPVRRFRRPAPAAPSSARSGASRLNPTQDRSS